MSEQLSRGKGTATHDTNANSDNFFNGFVSTGKKSYDPYVSGFAYIKWLYIPEWVEKQLEGGDQFKALSEKNFKALGGISDIEMEVEGIKAGFTGNETNYAKGITKNGGFTLKYQEQSSSPMTKVTNAWVSGIRDPNTGIATYPKDFGKEYHSSNHTGALLFVVTKPDADNFDGNNIEFAAIFTNVMPTKIFLNHFNFESGNHDFTEIEQEYKGTLHIGAKVEEYAMSKIKSGVYTFRNENNFKAEDYGL